MVRDRLFIAYFNDLHIPPSIRNPKNVDVDRTRAYVKSTISLPSDNPFGYSSVEEFVRQGPGYGFIHVKTWTKEDYDS